MKKIDWNAMVGDDPWRDAVFRMCPEDPNEKKGDSIGQKEFSPLTLLAHEQIVNAMAVSLIADSYPLSEDMTAIEMLSRKLCKDRHCILSASNSGESKTDHDGGILNYKVMPFWNDLIACIQLIPTLIRQYGNHEFSPYVNEFIKRFSKYVINPDDLQDRSRQLDPVIAWKKRDQLYQDILRFHYRLNSQLVVKAVKDRIDAAEQNRESMQGLINSLLRQHHQLDMLCVELGYMPKYFPRVTFEHANRDRKALLKHLDQWIHLGYVWRLEQSSMRGFQYQLVVFLDTQNQANVLAIAAALGEFWRKLNGFVKTKEVNEPPADTPRTEEKSASYMDNYHDAQRYIIYEVARQKYNQREWPSHFFCGRVSSETKGKLDELCFQMTMPAYLLRWNPSYLEQIHQEISIEKEIFQDGKSSDLTHRLQSEKEYLEDEARYAEMILSVRSESQEPSLRSKKNRTFQTSVFPRGKPRNLLKRFKLALEESI